MDAGAAGTKFSEAAQTGSCAGLSAGKEIEGAVQRLAQMAEESYKAGKANILTVIDAQRNANQVEQEYLDSLVAAQSAFATLEETVGAPLD